MSEIAPAETQQIINDHGFQNLPFTIDPNLCVEQPRDEIELLDLDVDMTRDRIMENAESPFLLNFDLDSHHLDAINGSEL